MSADPIPNAVELFLRGRNSRNARHELRCLVTDLLITSHQTKPPVNLYKIARFRGIARILRRQLDVDAQIERRDHGYDIVLNSSTPRRRQRFSLAHEIAHTFFLDYQPEAITRQRVTTTSERRALEQEESLCNFGAGELLMPFQQFSDEAQAVGPSILALRWLADRWDVSLEACGSRVCDLAVWPVVFLWFKGDGAGYSLNRASGLAPGTMPLLRTEYPSNSLLARRLSEDASWSGRLRLSLGGPAGMYFCEALRYHDGRSALLMCILHEQAEDVCGRSRLQIWSRRRLRVRGESQSR